MSGISCSGTASNEPEARPSGSSEEPEYIRSKRTSNFGTSEVLVISDHSLQQKRSILGNSELQEMDFTQKYNTKVYKFTNGPVTFGYLIKPRVLLKSSILGDRTFIERTEKDLIVHVSIAFVDGKVDEIATGIGTEKIPKKFKIDDVDKLMTEVLNQSENPVVFISRIPCPKRVRIFLDGETPFSVTLNTHLNSCPLNTFIPAKLVLSKEDWKRLKLGFLRENSVEIETEIDLTTPVAVEYAELSIQKSEVYSFLSNRFGPKEDCKTNQELQGFLKDLVNEIQNGFQLNFQDENFTDFKELVAKDFFERNPSKADERVCSTLQGIDGAEKLKSFHFTIQKEKFFGRPLFLRSRSTLNDDLSGRQPFHIKASIESPLEPVDQESIGEVSNTLKTVGEGDVIEFGIEALSAGLLQLDTPIVDTKSYNYCPFNYEHYRTYEVFPPRPPGGGMPSPYITPKYKTEKYSECEPDHVQKRWTKTTTWSVPIAQPKFSPIPLTTAEMDAVLSGLSLRFRWTEDDEIKEVACPLKPLVISYLPKFHVLVELKNTSLCSPFNKANRKHDRNPTLDFLNKSSIVSEFQCGSLVEDFAGNRTYRCVGQNGKEEIVDSTLAKDAATLARGERVGLFKKYYPRLQIQTRIRNVGSYFENDKSEEGANK